MEQNQEGWVYVELNGEASVSNCWVEEDELDSKGILLAPSKVDSQWDWLHVWKNFQETCVIQKPVVS